MYILRYNVLCVDWRLSGCGHLLIEGCFKDAIAPRETLHMKTMDDVSFLLLLGPAERVIAC